MPRRRRHPDLSLPIEKPTGKAEVRLDSDDSLSHEIAEPVFRADIHQVAILNKIDYVRTDLRTSNRHVLLVLLQGDMGTEADGRLVWLHVGDIACIPAGTPFRMTGKKNGNFRTIYITIFDTPRWSGLKKRGAYVREYESADFLYLHMRRLLNAYLARDVTSIAHANRDSYGLVDLLMREATDVVPGTDDHGSALKELVERMRLKPCLDWNNEAMARSVHMSERTFMRVFKKEYGVSPKMMLIRQRMIAAAQRLANSSDKIDIISRDLGYANIHSFSDLFLRQMGVRPSEFRRRHHS